MKVGIAKENRSGEKRVVMQPPEIIKIASRHEVLIEKGAGEGIDIQDSCFTAAGCKIASRIQIFTMASEGVLSLDLLIFTKLA